MKFRKKPVVVEAIQWDVTKKTFDEIKAMGISWEAGLMGSETFYIDTLEGTMLVSKGDWIIKGVNGEFYPVKDDIFQKTYEKVE